jgi:hypothetical protein
MIQYEFWFWTNKLAGVLAMLSALVGYTLSEEEFQQISEGLRGTKDKKGYWYDYSLRGMKFTVDLKLAYDTDEGAGMIHVKIHGPKELKEKLALLDLFQSMFKELEIER